MRVLLNGTVHTMAAAEPASAVAYDGNTIAAVGAEAVRLAREPGVETTDLAGRCVVPGFVDAHHHLAAAVLYRGAVDCSPAAVRSIEAMQARLRAAAAALPAGAWILGTGWDDWALAEGRAPTRDDLDAACPDHPVLAMHFSFHQGVASSRALALAGIGRETRDPPAGKIERGRGGEPNGRLYETAVSPVETLAAEGFLAHDAAHFADRLARYQDELFAAGITRLADPTVSRDVERVYREAHAAGRLRIPVTMMPVSDQGYLLHPTDRLDDAPTGEGTDTLRVGPLKLFFDGGDNCAMCLTVAQSLRMAVSTAAKMLRMRSLMPLRFAMRTGGRLALDPSTGSRRRLHIHSGIRYYPTDEDAARMAGRAVERGWTLAVHAMGNEAVGQAVRTFAAVRARHRDAPPPRIEHAMLADAATLRRAADLGLVVVSQPSFLRIPAVQWLPSIPGLPALPFRAMRDAGVRVAGSSDAPVTGFAPLDGLRDAVERRLPSGELVAPEQALTPLEVLAMYTREAAVACGWGDVAGTLEVGKRADLVVLSGDPARARLEELAVVETIAGGESVYRAAGQW